MSRINWILATVGLVLPFAWLNASRAPAEQQVPATPAAEQKSPPRDHSVANAGIKDEGEYGSLSGQVTLEGEIPDLPALVKRGQTTVKDAAVCAAAEIPDERLVVDRETRGIAHVFVSLKQAGKIHPDLAVPPKGEIAVQIQGCRFIPHAFIARTEQTIRVFSQDPIAHNPHDFPVRGLGMRLPLKPHDLKEGMPFKYRVSEQLPFQIKCDFHPWMRTHWLIVEHPYAAVTNARGEFTIHGLPAGDHEFVVWHEAAGYVQKSLEVTVVGGGKSQLPAITVPAASIKLP